MEADGSQVNHRQGASGCVLVDEKRGDWRAVAWIAAADLLSE